MNVLNYTTYYEMKERGGTIGKKGVAPLIDKLSDQVERIHLIGHSFGGRVVAAAAANSTTNRIRSMTLLQAAFSHNGFSQSMNGFFRNVVDGRRVSGPIIITHTKNDKAVGFAYPIASRLAGQVAAGLGDENDRFGGIGRNGAQKMNSGEVIAGKLLPVGASYVLSAGKCFNAEASDFIKGHGSLGEKDGLTPTVAQHAQAKKDLPAIIKRAEPKAIFVFGKAHWDYSEPPIRDSGFRWVQSVHPLFDFGHKFLPAWREFEQILQSLP